MDNVDSNIKIPATEVLAELKAQAGELGITFNRNIGVAKLQIKIDQAVAAAKAATIKVPEPQPETISQRNVRLRKLANKLIRVKVSCLNPNKRQWPGQLITVANTTLGRWKKYIPFNNEAGYHIPMAIYNKLVASEHQIFYTVKGRNGKPDMKRGKLVKEFNVEVLPPLTTKELEALATQQALRSAGEEV